MSTPSAEALCDYIRVNVLGCLILDNEILISGHPASVRIGAACSSGLITADVQGFPLGMTPDVIDAVWKYLGSPPL